MEVPHHLKSDFRVLEDICFQMKKTHPNMKRSVKFDDDRLGLMVDVNLVGDDWKRIRPDQAKAVKRDEPSLWTEPCLLYTSPSPRDRQKTRMPSSA